MGISIVSVHQKILWMHCLMKGTDFKKKGRFVVLAEVIIMEGQWVYSTNIEGNRFSIKCLTVLEQKFALNNFLVDTGAVITCCEHKYIDTALNEKDLVHCEPKIIGGLVNGSTVKFYRYPLKRFTVGTIDLGKQDIWITFDARVTDIVLGMDILRQIVLIINPYNQKIYFCKDARDYEQSFQLMVEMVK